MVIFHSYVSLPEGNDYIGSYWIVMDYNGICFTNLIWSISVLFKIQLLPPISHFDALATLLWWPQQIPAVQGSMFALEHRLRKRSCGKKCEAFIARRQKRRERLKNEESSSSSSSSTEDSTEVDASDSNDSFSLLSLGRMDPRVMIHEHVDSYKTWKAIGPPKKW